MAVNDKRTLYVGGLEESVNEATLRAAFLYARARANRHCARSPDSPTRASHNIIFTFTVSCCDLVCVSRPFGEITDVNLPLDTSTQKHKGFGFVQFDDKDDAAEAIDNMNDAELFGRVLRVNLAKPDAIKGGNRPVWESRADDFFKGGGDDDASAE